MMRSTPAAALGLRHKPLALLSACALAAGLLSPFASQAALLGDLESGDRSKVELLFVAWENNAGTGGPKAYFVKDLGKTMADMFTAGQVDAGVQFSWLLGGTGATADDAAWTSFVNTDLGSGVKPDMTKVRWAVVAVNAFDNSSYAPGSVQLFTTNLQGVSGSATVIPGLSTTASDTMTEAYGNIGTFYNDVKSQGTIGSATNGSAVILKSNLQAYTWPNWNGDIPDLTFGKLSRSTGNLVGKSSWFYYLTGGDSSGFDGSKPVLIDEFDNLGNDGYWGFIKSTVPGKTDEYFLSYNLAAYRAATEVATGTLTGNNFARLAGTLSLDSAAGRGQSVLSMTEDFVRGFVAENSLRTPSSVGSELVVAQAVSAVPEPGSWALMGLGAGALALLARRRRVAAAVAAPQAPVQG